MSLRGIDDFMVGTDNGAMCSIFSRQPLDDLIGPLTSF